MCFSSDLKKRFSWLMSFRQPGAPADRASVALFVYITLFPVFLFFGLLLPPDWQRFGFQWQALGLTALASSSVFFSDEDIRGRYWSWFLSSRAVFFVLLFLVYLMLMAVRHGVVVQQVSLASGFLFACLSPVLIWCCAACASGIHRLMIAFAMVSVLLVEDVFLVVYRIGSVPLGTSSLLGHDLPRLFINVRDGNAWAIAVSVVAFYLSLVFSGSSRSGQWWLGKGGLLFGASLLWFLVFINGWITQGRGLFFSTLCAISVFLVVQRPSRLRLFLAPIVIGLVSSFFSHKIVSWLSCGASGCRESMIDRLVSDASFERYGRLDIWSSWIRSGLNHSFVWGHGFGFKPDSLMAHPIYTPHNLFVQIVSDSGLFGLLVSVFLMILFASIIKRSGIAIGSLGIYALVVSLVYLSVAAVLFWAVGVWLISMIPFTFQKNEEFIVNSSDELRLSSPLMLGLASACFVSLIVMLVGKVVLLATL